MTTDQRTGPAEALAPVRAALLARARATADAKLAEADAEAELALRQAREEAASILARARTAGEADARSVRAGEHARARRVARGLVLAARRHAYEELRRRSQQALRQQDPAVLASALTDRVRATLGDSARLAAHPSGGLVGEDDGRRVDCSIEALADRSMSLLAGELSGLWSP